MPNDDGARPGPPLADIFRDERTKVLGWTFAIVLAAYAVTEFFLAQGFARAREMVSFVVDTEDFASVLLQYHRAPHGFADRVHANAAISQVAARWKCSVRGSRNCRRRII